MTIASDLSRIAVRLEIDERIIRDVLGFPNPDDAEVRQNIENIKTFEDALAVLLDERVVPGTAVAEEAFRAFEDALKKKLADTLKFWEIMELADMVRVDHDELLKPILERALTAARKPEHFVQIYSWAMPGSEVWKEAVRLAVATVHPE